FVRETSNNNDGQPPHDEVFGDVLSSDDEGILETVFGSNLSSNKRANEDNEEVHSEDPFGVYDLLEKNKKVVGSMFLKLWRVLFKLVSLWDTLWKDVHNI
nr:hypothetical protein [Tanacetum cinerariifolium]